MVTRTLPQLDVVDGNKTFGTSSKATVNHQFMVMWKAVLSFVRKPMRCWVGGQIDHEDVCQISICEVHLKVITIKITSYNLPIYQPTRFTMIFPCCCPNKFVQKEKQELSVAGIGGEIRRPSSLRESPSFVKSMYAYIPWLSVESSGGPTVMFGL